MAERAVLIKVKGLVQGVGFRPFVYKLALKYDVKGWVENRNDGVLVKAEGKHGHVHRFISAIRIEAPRASNITSIHTEESPPEKFKDFRIIKSENISEDVTEICPDIAVCSECLDDMKRQHNRINYPFINCTNCGPRFTIIRDLPYDRDKTTMQPFVMCPECKKEYVDILERRFHAQPVACSVCGPQYELLYRGESIKDFAQVLDVTARMVNEGGILAVKGTGGFFMMCDATCNETVNRLRKNKNREAKPFAVMFPNIEKVKEYAEVNGMEEENLTSWKRPIVLLRQKKNLAQSVNVGFNTIGAMLPYMPLHYLLFERLQVPAVVLTSGNISDEPIVISNGEAMERLSPAADAVLVYNRDIYNRTDDSVEMNVNGEERVIRRSRGFVPNPIDLGLNTDGIFAAGAELVNCFCIGKGSQAILSQHIGDLKNIETYEFYTESIERFKKLFRITPSFVAYDMHPDYFSTRYALETKLDGIPVQHHHAHVASCMAEHGLDEDVIGVSLDGTGYGTDGNIWGGEFLIADLADFRRYTHFEYIPLPGGDKVTREPWRTGLSYLYQVYGKDFLHMGIPFLEHIEKGKKEMIIQAIERKINCPLSSSAGRLFDAVAAITNLCPVSGFHAEAPMRLEAAIENENTERYDFEINECISFHNMMKEIVQDIKSDKKVSFISSKFHNSIIYCIFAVASKIREETRLNKVALSGGAFQNRYLLGKVEKLLKENGFDVYSHKKVPSNDGGIALGQLAVAAKRLKVKSA